MRLLTCQGLVIDGEQLGVVDPIAEANVLVVVERNSLLLIIAVRSDRVNLDNDGLVRSTGPCLDI